MLQKDLTEQLPHQTNRYKFIPLRLFFHCLKEPVNQLAGYGTGRLIRLNLRTAFKKRIVFCLTYGATAEKAVHIKDNALVNAVAGSSAVDGPGGNDGCITLV